MTVHCAYCGKALTLNEGAACVHTNAPYSCAAHRRKVNEENAKGIPMWPNGWHGKSYQTLEGDWWYIHDFNKNAEQPGKHREKGGKKK